MSYGNPYIEDFGKFIGRIDPERQTDPDDDNDDFDLRLEIKNCYLNIKPNLSLAEIIEEAREHYIKDVEIMNEIAEVIAKLKAPTTSKSA